MRKMLIIALCVAALAACGQSAQAPAAGGATSQSLPTGQPTPAEPSPAPPLATARPTTAPAPTGAPADVPSSAPQPSDLPPDSLVDTAQRQLAAHLDVGPDQLALQSAEQREWPDGSLGCPQEGMAYPEVVLEGFLLVFADLAQTQSYEVHTAIEPAQMVLCEDGEPVDLSVAESTVAPATPPVDAATQPAVDAAKAALAQEIGVKAADIAAASVEEVVWNDSSLGCPKPGQVYMQVITPGFRIVLEAQGQRYEYHSDLGRNVVRC